MTMKILRWLALSLFAVTLINYPNPFNPRGGEVMTFECTATASAGATLYIYDMAARLVTQRAFNIVSGTSQASWNGYSDDNELVGNGVYLVRLFDPAGKTTLAKGKAWVINK